MLGPEGAAVAPSRRCLPKVHSQGAAGLIGRDKTQIVKAEVIDAQLPGPLDGMARAVDEKL